MEAKYCYSSLIIYYKGFMPDGASQKDGRQPTAYIVKVFCQKLNNIMVLRQSVHFHENTGIRNIK